MNLSDNYSTYREKMFKIEGTGYPGKALVDMELKPGYEEAKHYRIRPMLELNEAQLIMLIEQGIIPREEGRIIASALESCDYDSFRNRQYTGEFEDLFFEIEDCLIKATDGLAGNIHLARSRNDMSLCMDHMVVRTKLLELLDVLIEVRNTVYLFAKEHRDTMYVAYTHAQHAQPSVFGHYFLGVFDFLGRDIKRFEDAYSKVNSSPMGAAAITTSGFNISRERVAELLGFTEVIENSFDAIGNIDFNTDTASAVIHAAIDLGRHITDLVTWATEGMDMIRLADGYISTSSIMPQKRNPIALEHLRSSLSVVKGLAASVIDGYMKSPYGDISDHEDIEPILIQAIDLLILNYRLYNAVIATMDVNKEKLNAMIDSSFSVVTEMADTLVRETGLPFRKSHHIVSALVKKTQKLGMTVKDIDYNIFCEVYSEVTGEKFRGDFNAILRSLDSANFIAIRNVYGGIGPKAMKEQIEHAKEKVEKDVAWYQNACLNVINANERRYNLIKDLLS